MELAGQGDSRFIELEVSEYLGEGQNFYDQPPLGNLIRELSTKDQLNKDKLRACLTSMVANPDRYFLRDGELMHPKIRHRTFLENLKGMRAQKFEPGEYEVYYQAMEELDKLLSEYPFIGEYINTKFDRGIYSQNGNWRGKSGSLFTVTSYAGWLREKALRENNNHSVVLLGIEEVFPQDIGQEGLVIPTGDSPQVRRWRILKAAELIRKK